jgi:hypothetical protein
LQPQEKQGFSSPFPFVASASRCCAENSVHKLAPNFGPSDYDLLRYSPLSRQKTGLNKIVSGAVFKRGAAAPLIYLPAVARKAVKGDANCFLVRGVQRSEALRAQPLDGLRSVGYSARQ